MKVRGYAAATARAPLSPWQFERRQMGPDDVVLDIHYAGICHSDIHQAREEWGKALFPMVPGHEIAGVVTGIGQNVRKFKIGDRIGVGVFVDSCRICPPCKAGLQQYCIDGKTDTYNGYERDGKTVAYGGYSNRFVIHQDYAVQIPENLPLEGVAPLLCAGITLYSPLKHWKAGPGKKIAIVGLGGLGHMGVKFAHALGAEVSVLSHSPGKEKDALAMGADKFLLTNDWALLKPFSGYFDLILNTVSAEIPVDEYLNLLKLDGSLVFIGLSGKPYPVSAFNLLAARRSISGSQIGGIPETQEMLDFCGEKNIISDVEVINADYINTAYERTISSDVKYRFVIDASTF